MTPLNQNEREELNALLAAGNPLPEKWMHRLFPNGRRAEVVGKEYRLVYDGKLSREEVLSQTPAAPWQHVRSFCTERPHGDGWRNLLVWGDNLMALRELLADQQGANRFGTKGKIKLIYIDPPFATKQDFMKDKEKAYRDKVLGAQFIEFLRRRLILLHEILADDGTIYVHLDQKKGHYLKATLDEVFGETNFRNEVIWYYRRYTAKSSSFQSLHDCIYRYTKTDEYIFNDLWEPHSETAGKKDSHYKQDEDGRWFRLQKRAGKDPYKVFLNENGKRIGDVWELQHVNASASERTGYPTQKPEELIERVINASSNPGDIVIDCFGGSGSVPAVAEKLGRRWIAMDCGKLAVYTTIKRAFTLTKTIGPTKKDDRAEHERVEDWSEHLKGASGVLLVTEKARKGECEVTLDLLYDLAALAYKHDLVKAGASLSLVCPQEKLQIPDNQFTDAEDAPGAKRITISLKEGKKTVSTVEFRLTIIAPKEKPADDQALPAKEFALYRAGIYDMAVIKGMPWADYRPFVLKLFGVREHSHSRYGLELNGYIGTDSALLWNYPDHPSLTLDYGYVDDLHRTVRGKSGERFYVIAPVVAMAFAEDEVKRGETTYVFLKVPMSVLLRLIARKEPAALRQPAKEEDVNEVIDAVGFDFISQPQVAWKPKKESSKDGLFTVTDYVLEVTEFRAQTLATDPEDFQNFETFSMAMVDLNYNGDVFQLSRVFWGETLLAAAGGIDKAEKLELRIAEADFTGEQVMVILCDRYGNEKSLLLEKGDFEGKPRKTANKTVAKRAATKTTIVKTTTKKGRRSK